MIIHHYADQVRLANESFYGSLRNSNKLDRILAADKVVSAMNDYVDSLHDNPHELHALYESNLYED
jgi:hypothetical protein